MPGSDEAITAEIEDTTDPEVETTDAGTEDTGTKDGPTEEERKAQADADLKAEVGAILKLAAVEDEGFGPSLDEDDETAVDDDESAKDDADKTAADDDKSGKADGAKQAGTEREGLPALDDDLLHKAVGTLGLRIPEAQRLGNEGIKRLLDREPKADAETKAPAEGDKEQERSEWSGFAQMLEDAGHETEIVEVGRKVDSLVGVNQKLQTELDEIKAARTLEQQAMTDNQQAAAEQREAAVLRSFDKLVQGLDDSFQSVLGKGSWPDVTKGGAEDTNREDVYVRMHTIASEYISRGKDVPPENDLFLEAFNGLFPNHATTKAQKRVKDQINNRKNQRMVKPSKRRDMPLSKKEREAALVAEIGDILDENAGAL